MLKTMASRVKKRRVAYCRIKKFSIPCLLSRKKLMEAADKCRKRTLTKTVLPLLPTFKQHSCTRPFIITSNKELYHWTNGHRKDRKISTSHKLTCKPSSHIKHTPSEVVPPITIKRIRIGSGNYKYTLLPPLVDADTPLEIVDLTDDEDNITHYDQPSIWLSRSEDLIYPFDRSKCNYSSRPQIKLISNSVKKDRTDHCLDLNTVLTNVDKDHPFYQTLLAWQKILNSKTTKEGRIFVENLHDDAGPPEGFSYITSCISREDVPLHNPTALVGCICTNCKDSRHCCPHMAGHRLAYTVTGKVRFDKGFPIYECNIMCSCDSSCLNRVVQRGRQFPVSIFRTFDGRGWGVKTCINIKRGTFVTEYIGEIITSEEAERRGEKYDREGSTYLFDLDFVEDHSVFTIDAGRYGNISHFFNHSCDPNLQVYSVWINNLDPRLPHLALFAKRDIAKGEELTFDYQMSRNIPTGQKGRVPCLCGAKDCIGFLY